MECINCIIALLLLNHLYGLVVKRIMNIISIGSSIQYLDLPLERHDPLCLYPALGSEVVQIELM